MRDNETVSPLFDRINWQDPISGKPLEPIISARTPSGVPICGAMRIQGTETGYPIVDCIVRLSPELAVKYKDWLEIYSLTPPVAVEDNHSSQQTETVDSFGWQWTWNSMMRSDEDLKMRVSQKFKVDTTEFTGKVIIDAGAGAGDQSKYILSLGASVVSVDLSSAIEVVARKLRMNSNWVGVQADIAKLPFANEQFDMVYCEGVIQHTQDSVMTVRELFRTLKLGGKILAAHYTRDETKSTVAKIKGSIYKSYYDLIRKRLSQTERFKLLFITGLIAALNNVPLIGYFLRKSKTVLYYELMPDFKTTWTNTFDYYGNHTYQRFLTPEEFAAYFIEAGNMELVYFGKGNIVAKKVDLIN